jgi:hypothetical protein
MALVLPPHVKERRDASRLPFMIDAEAAQKLAQGWLDTHRPGAFIYSADEFPWGWAIQYESRQFFETQNLDFLMADRSPIYIMRDGSLREPVADASMAPDEQVELFNSRQG